MVCSPALAVVGARAVGGLAALAAGAAVDQLFMSSESKNLDRSAKEPGQQFDEIDAAQQAARKRGQPDRIQSTRKSKQRDRQESDEEAARALEELRQRRKPQ